MPQLPITQPVSLWAPTPTAQSADDVLAPMPEKYRLGNKPVTQAIAGALAAHTAAHDEAVEYAAAQSDLTRATGRYLDGKAEDHGFVRALNETDEDFRARILAWHPAGTREAIAQAINETVAKYSVEEATVFDPILDGWYVETGAVACAWSSHVWVEGTVGDHRQNYPDQFYLERTNTKNIGTLTLLDTAEHGRCFGVFIPPIRQSTGELMWIQLDQGAFVGDGLELVPMTFTSAQLLTNEEVVSLLERSIEGMRAHGVRWSLLEDSRV